MNRRTLLKQLAMATTAAVLLPSCLRDPKKVSIALNNLNVNGDDEELVSLLADTLVPATDKPGAKAVAAHLYTFVMVDDCFAPEKKEKYIKGMRAFDESCEAINGKSFTESNTEERLALLKQIETNREKNTEELNTFYFGSKHYIVEGYMTSQYFLTEVKPYELVPGPTWKGCAPVSQTPNA